MTHLHGLYGCSLALLTDLYQLTMAYGYWKSGRQDHQAVFHLFFRHPPFGGEFAVAAGLPSVLELMEEFQFKTADLDYLATLRGNDDRQLFEPGFLDYLAALELSCDIEAVPEGTVVFAREPLLRVSGPLLHCQLLETPLLNLVNFPTLVATKACRVCHLAVPGQAVLEFGLRRAQGIDGGVSASRAAYLGGCAGTSNVLAGRLFDIPVRGTHAHSWVMSFDDEEQSFRTYAEALPNNCIFLVDTYDTLQGVERAIEVGRELRRRGHEMVGIRLDSGDLAELSRAARRRLDEAGFEKASIVASGDLDEYRMVELVDRGARIDVWGVGTRLATAFDEPALGGVYKLAAIRSPGEAWSYRLKVSDEAEKSTDPGMLQVRRFSEQDLFVGDVIYDLELGLERDGGEDLLQGVVRDGRPCVDPPDLEESRRRLRHQLERLPAAVKELRRPASFPVELEPRLEALKARLAAEALSGSGN